MNGHDERGLERLTRLVAVTALVALVLAVLAPFAIHEQRPTGLAADTAAPVTGEAQAATDGLRGSASAARTSTFSPKR